MEAVSCSKFFSTLNLPSGYSLVRLGEKMYKKLTFATRSGLWRWLVLHFRLATASATFQRQIVKAMWDCFGKTLPPRWCNSHSSWLQNPHPKIVHSTGFSRSDGSEAETIQIGTTTDRSAVLRSYSKCPGSGHWPRYNIDFVCLGCPKEPKRAIQQRANETLDIFFRLQSLV